MKTRRLLAITSMVGLFFYLGACAFQGSTGEENSANISFERISKRKQSLRCKENKNICATVTVNYPTAKYGDEFVVNAINQTVKKKILESLAVFSDLDKKLVADIDSAMVGFIHLYDNFITASEFFTVPWELKVDGKIVYQSDKIVSIKLENYSFTGGAHPNSNVCMLNFDAQTGQLLQLKDIITDMEEFVAIINNRQDKKREKRPINAGPSIELASTSYSGLPENFSIDKKGILFHYNPYEVGTYADGSYSFFLTFDALDEVLIKSRLFNE